MHVCMCLWSQMLTCVSSSVALDTSRQGLSRQLEFTALARFARDPSVSVHPASPSFHMGAGDLNCGPHACTADTFPVEPSPQPQRAAACLTLYADKTVFLLLCLWAQWSFWQRRTTHLLNSLLESEKLTNNCRDVPGPAGIEAQFPRLARCASVPLSRS